MAGKVKRRVLAATIANGGEVPMNVPSDVPTPARLMKNVPHTPGALYGYPGGIKPTATTWLDRTYQLKDQDWILLEVSVKAQESLVNICTYLRFLETPKTEQEAEELIKYKLPKLAELIPFWRVKGNVELRATLYKQAVDGNFQALKMILAMQLGITDAPKAPDDAALSKQADALQEAMRQLGLAKLAAEKPLNLAELE